MLHNAVLTILREFQGQHVFFEPLGGNNGDNLIEMGAMCVFEKLKLTLATSPREASVIIINGSGDLSYHPASKPIEDTRQAKYLLQFPDKPVVLLPSSSTKMNADRLSAIIKNRKAETTIFARDTVSYSYFKSLEAPGVNVFLDHDMAFGLYGSEWLAELAKKTSSGTLLVVERFDAEGATAPPMIYKTPVFLRSLVPSGLKNFIKRKALHSIHKNTPFVTESSAKVKELYAGLTYERIQAADISLPQNHSFDSFVETISGASVVVSTRLHVCILSALLGKPFIAIQFEGGNKLSGVFDYSLRNYPNAKLWIRKRESA